ncbi:MAG: AIPR family protein [Devosia sp. 67-54]|uniref:AIPR family protein n=1 Tax=unclassified Devosia TaxID=196773 RepID=UPI0009602E49|nr:MULTISPECIES: AIPR family protein [unclassified Devosia]MBN9304817.1 AIPR family protein [Devosia sp.]OJX15223.1 MAG: AIPR family protein [Devosia sp. 67-54]
MEQLADEFFHDLRQELLAGAEANSAFQLSEFMETVTRDLIETGFVEGFELCHFRAQRGMRVDGYWFDDEGGLDLFIADFDCRAELESLTRTDVDAAFKRLASFFEAAIAKDLYNELEITSPEYGLARQIADRKGLIRRLNLILVSERAVSDRVQILEDAVIAGVPAGFHVWDISRLQRQRGSKGQKEPLDLDFPEMFGAGVSCLPAHLGSEAYRSYLVVMPAEILADLYGRYGGRLLEQNVRSFLQARAKVNKGIRTTILNEPQMFFAYNNGITATAQEVDVRPTTGGGLEIARIKDLQIVNGGQTTASLFHTRRQDKASLKSIFVQMKLSVIDSAESETVVPRISEYANTQNRVNAADFFSNHPFHIRMEEFSRRLWAPAQQGAQRETKWFYERARGQYADAQAKLTPADQRRFKAENPKPQMFAKTDLAKFENVWDDHPRWVNLGAQKNFARFAGRIGKEWSDSPDTFNEFYFRRAIGRAIIFRATERMVSDQSWYSGGYRANIVAYAIAALGEVCRQESKSIDYSLIWNNQAVPDGLLSALAVAAKFVNDDITNPPPGISNVSEWAKRDACWTRMKEKLGELEAMLPPSFWSELVSSDEVKAEKKDARKVQKLDNGINHQMRVVEVGGGGWGRILREGTNLRIFTPQELSLLRLASLIPAKLPNEKQSADLVAILEKAAREGIAPK